MKTRLVVIILSLFVFTVTSFVLAQGNSIMIPSQVQVKNLEVKLTEIAKIQGSTNFIAKIDNLSLGQAPYPGYKRVIYRDDVLYALKKAEVNLQNLTLRIPYQFSISSNYSPLDIDKIVTYGKQYISDKLGYSKEKIEIKALNAPQELLVPQGEIDFQIAKNPSRKLLGVNMLPIKVMANGQLYRQFYIKFRTKLWADVLVANKRLNRGQSLTKDLFTAKKKLITTQGQDYITNSENLANKVMKRRLSQGQALTTSMVETPALIKRWQEVQIIAKVGGVVVTTTGKSLQLGHKGEIIKVKNLDSGKKIKARVIAKNKVQVIIQ